MEASEPESEPNSTESKARRSTLVEDRRTQLLEAAAKVLATRGARHMRLSDVADEAGVSIGMVQHYFRSRSELLLETFRAAYQNAATTLDGISEEESDPVERLIRLIDHSIQADRWPIWIEYWGAAYRDPAILENCESQYRRWSSNFHEAIEYGVEAGVFTPRNPVDDIADQLLAMINGLAIRLIMRDFRVDDDRAHHLIGVLLRDELDLQQIPVFSTR